MAAPRVCIVGGGAAGLAAAWYLGKRGYRDVVVLEKEDRPGGKCDTVALDGRAVDRFEEVQREPVRRAHAARARTPQRHDDVTVG